MMVIGAFGRVCFNCFFTAILLLAFTGVAIAQVETKQDTTSKSLVHEQQNRLTEQKLKSSADLEIDGLIVDETVTKTGRTFYDIFHMQWEAPIGVKNFSITIKEKPARGNFSLLSVEVNEESIFEYQLQPRYEMIEEAANYVVSLVYDYLVNDQLTKQLEAEGKKLREVY
jgi:curli production assembly/transport component CsgE